MGGEALLAGNFPAIHAVGRASAQAPRLTEIRWTPPATAESAGLPRLVLIGKGVCFDSGGLDIKPGSGMALDEEGHGRGSRSPGIGHMLMAGAHSSGAAHPGPAVEKRHQRNAYRPGTLLATRKGLSVEIGNTDAEGRLVLCDALALADADQPDLIIDFATLTGAARVAWDLSFRRCSAPTRGWFEISRAPRLWSTTLCGQCRSGWVTTMNLAARSRTSTTWLRPGLPERYSAPCS